jgi:hypothetical protein
MICKASFNKKKLKSCLNIKEKKEWLVWENLVKDF